MSRLATRALGTLRLTVHGPLPYRAAVAAISIAAHTDQEQAAMSSPLLELHHDPRPGRASACRRPMTWPRWGSSSSAFPRNAFGSIDVTNRCNLRCTHCYYYAGPEEALPGELSADEWVARLEEIKRTRPVWEFPFFNCTWVGGDPLIRKDVIERCKPYFRYNTVVTNGTMPLPDWPDVHWYVSIDGDAEHHERIRDPQGAWRRNGKPGLYARIKENVARAKHLGITITYVITRDNAHCIEGAVKEWYEAGAKHITSIS
jgi:MoaA/NifB/PqqE/SkfB family radical SAM enzyme